MLTMVFFFPYLTSKVALEEPESRSTDLNSPIDSNCIYDKQHFTMAGGSNDFHNEAHEIDESDAITTVGWPRWAPTDLESFDQASSDVG